MSGFVPSIQGKLPLQGQGRLPACPRGLPLCCTHATPQPAANKRVFFSFPFGSSRIFLKFLSASHPLQHRLCRSSRRKLRSGLRVAIRQNISCSLSPRVWERIPVVYVGLCLISPLHAAAECWPGRCCPAALLHAATDSTVGFKWLTERPWLETVLSTHKNPRVSRLGSPKGFGRSVREMSGCV